jgi:glycosyltransferase involved in cell wall biosynthesis
MRILLVHNHYRRPGGEDVVFQSEAALLRSHHHDVEELVATNDDIDSLGRLQVAIGTIWSRRSGARLREILARHRPEIVHFHNTFPLISPAAYSTARQSGAAVVQTLHNYRLICPNGLLFRDGHLCEECVGRSVAWPGVLHACYRHSRPQTGVVTAMLAVHRARGTWVRDVDAYIALTEFARRKFIQGGLPESKLAVKPNFVDPDPGESPGRGGHFLFVGRLSEEKGVRTLLRAWSALGSNSELRIAGAGPLEAEVRRAAAGSTSIRYLGHLARPAVLEQLRAARALIFPSEWFEGMPVVILEAFACGRPVIATRHGGPAEIIADGVTGLLFTPESPDELAQRTDWAIRHEEAMAVMGKQARQEHELRYTPEVNYRLLMDIYQRAARERTTARAGST